MTCCKTCKDKEIRHIPYFGYWCLLTGSRIPRLDKLRLDCPKTDIKEETNDDRRTLPTTTG
jgi:hypothetical protein